MWRKVPYSYPASTRAFDGVSCRHARSARDRSVQRLIQRDSGMTLPARTTSGELTDARRLVRGERSESKTGDAFAVAGAARGVISGSRASVRPRSARERLERLADGESHRYWALLERSAGFPEPE